MPEWNRSQENARRVRQAERRAAAPEQVRMHIRADSTKAMASLDDVIGKLNELSHQAKSSWERAFEMPAPKYGGTFFYCPYRVEERHGGISITTCGTAHSSYNGSRFKTAAKYRQHWRRYHIHES